MKTKRTNIMDLEIARIIGWPDYGCKYALPTINLADIAGIKPYKGKPKVWHYEIICINDFLTRRFLVRQ